MSITKIIGFVSVIALLITLCVSTDAIIESPATAASTSDRDGASIIDAQVRAMSDLLLTEAMVHIGDKYVFGGRSPGKFDCSGYVDYCYQMALGITPKRIAGGRCAGSQYQYNGCIKIDKSEVVPGDLVFFGTSTKGISHVGIYVSEDKMINAANEKDGVCYKSISKFIPRFVAYGRVEGFGQWEEISSTPPQI